MFSDVASLRRPRAGAGRPRTEGDRSALVARDCWYVGLVAIVVVVAGLIVVGARARSNMYWTGDAPFFVAVAHHPFGTAMPGDHLLYGDAYRYGRIGFPLTAWLLAFGRVAWVHTTMPVVYVATFGAWVALAAEHLRRNGRSPALALWILAFPFSVLAYFRPELVSEPLAGALLLLVYLFERDGRRRAVLVCAAALILTREPMAVGLLPLVWAGWKERGFSALRDWFLVVLPYVLWTAWLRVHIGVFPFLDPGVSRRQALSGPFVGLAQVWHGSSASQQWGMIVALLTLVAGAVLALRGRSRYPLTRYPLTHGAVALCALIPFFGIAVYVHPIEAFRAVVPIQALLLIVALDRGEPAPVSADR